MTNQQLTIKTVEKGIQSNKESWELATFGMGCFWGPEARFGSITGVMQTSVGFAGGTSKVPTYRQMGDHTETVQIKFDPSIISYAAILKVFWSNHYPNRDQYKGRQYISLLHYHTEKQRQTIEIIKKEMEKELGEPIETEISRFSEFASAEERHQKYYLKRYPKAIEQLAGLYPSAEQLKDSTFAARLNGFVKGFGTKDSMRKEITHWSIGKGEKEFLTELFASLKW